MTSHAQIWPQGAEKQLNKVNVVVVVGVGVKGNRQYCSSCFRRSWSYIRACQYFRVGGVNGHTDDSVTRVRQRFLYNELLNWMITKPLESATSFNILILQDSNYNDGSSHWNIRRKGEYQDNRRYRDRLTTEEKRLSQRLLLMYFNKLNRILEIM